MYRRIAHLHLEARCLYWQEVFDIRTATEDPLQINPSSLHVYPDIKALVDSIQSVIPRVGFLLKLLRSAQRENNMTSLLIT